MTTLRRGIIAAVVDWLGRFCHSANWRFNRGSLELFPRCISEGWNRLRVSRRRLGSVQHHWRQMSGGRHGNQANGGMGTAIRVQPGRQKDGLQDLLERDQAEGQQPLPRLQHRCMGVCVVQATDNATWLVLKRGTSTRTRDCIVDLLMTN